MNIVQEPAVAPFEAPPAALRDGGFSEDWWGAFSIQHFVDQAELHATHADATGWLNYLTRFHPRNFWFADSGVQRWAYIEDYDNWQDTYGLDAVMAVYHSGHGGMDGNGVFFVPLGADWGGSHAVTSKEMRVGNEQANYIFWSTCLSLRVLDGQNPIKTWGGANGGFRMLFGFETISVDSGDYGKFFWEEWNKNKSLSQAWLDESWRISIHQAPSAVACGATDAEAKNRLFNERTMSWGHASSNYWWWRWYYAAPGIATREANLELPKDLLVADLRPPELSEQSVRNMLSRFDIDGPLPEALGVTPDGIASIEVGGQRVTLGSDGSMEAHLATPNRDNLTPLPAQQAVQAAQEAVGARGLGVDAELVFDRIRLGAEGGGSPEGSGELQGPFTTETTVQFRQLINGLPVLTPDAGQVRVTVDNDGTVTSLVSTIREIDRLSDRPRSTAVGPPSPGNGTVPAAPQEPDPEQRLAEAWSNRLATWAGPQGRAPSETLVVPGTTEVGYEIIGNEAVLAARRLVEVGLGRGCRKQYWVVAPLIA